MFFKIIYRIIYIEKNIKDAKTVNGYRPCIFIQSKPGIILNIRTIKPVNEFII